MKRHATTMVLALVGAVLALFLWLDRDRVTEDEKRRRENNVFTAFRREELSRIELGRTGDDGETVVLERDAKADGPWRLTRPREERADPQAVERLITALELATVQRKAAEDGALGLETPRAFGSLRMGSLVYRFALGGTSPRPEGSSYFRVDEEPPVVVSKDLTQTLLASADTYRDRTVVPYLSLELAVLSISHDAGGLTLEHIKGRWFRVAQHGLVASRKGTERIWAALAELRAEAFPKDADVDRLVARPVLTMRLVPRDGRPPGEIVFGDPCPGHPDDVVVLRKQPTRVAACAPRAVLDALRADPATVIERRPFLLEADEIEEIRFEPVGTADAGAGVGAVDLARKGDGFRARHLDRDLTTDEADAVSELLSRITASPAPKIRREDRDPPFSARSRVTVRAGEHEETVEIGEPDEDGLVNVRRAFDVARMRLSPEAVRRLLPQSSITRSRALVTDTRTVTRVLLRCGTPQELALREGRFELVQPSGFETDGTVVSLVEAFARGKVDRWVADADDGSFGLASSTCRVVLVYEDGNAPKTIVLGAEGENGVYGTVDGGGPGVFVAPLALRELASAIYVSRATLRRDPDSVASVRVVRAPSPSAASAPEEVRRELAGALYAERVLAVGPEARAFVATPDVELAITRADGGAPEVVRCAPAPPPPSGTGRRHACVVAGIPAAFAIDDERLGLLLGAPQSADPGPGDAAVARDAGPR